VRVSYVEIYNGSITDLLSGEKHLKVIEDPIAGPTVQNACEQVVMAPQSAFELIDFGERRRHTGSTDMNERSSRSHTVFRMVIESRKITSAGGGGEDEMLEAVSTPRSTSSQTNRGGTVHVSYVPVQR